MRVTVDVVHPADVLFFKRPIQTLLGRGDEVSILSREKDITCSLLDDFELPHCPISSAGSGFIGLAGELVRRDWAVLRAARGFRPDAMIGFGGLAISHVGRLLRIPSISFYDSDNARLQTRITWPFIHRLYVPEAYEGPVPAGRTTRLRGTKDLSYLHPRAFSPDRNLAVRHGLAPERDNFLVRVVAWRANHDLGKRGWTVEMLDAVVALLSRHGKVHLSSEVPLPETLEGFRYRGSLVGIHHLLGHCRMMVGESSTMASEAAMLGVPAIYAGRDVPGYIRALESAGLVTNIERTDREAFDAAIAAALSRSLEETTAARDAFVSGCPDWAEEVVRALDDCVAEWSEANSRG